MTLTDQQFLTGDKNGTPATIGGELRLPPSRERVPAVILVHGSGGIGTNVDRWAQELNGIGVAAFLLDTFTGARDYGNGHRPGARRGTSP